MQRVVFNFEAPDSTRYLNERYKAVIEPGVYHGYDLSVGTTTWGVTLTADTDPADGTKVLSSLWTNFGITIQEDDDVQDAVTIAAADPAQDRIDVIVCRHAYVEGVPPSQNRALYTKFTGTPGTPPVKPAIDPNDVELGTVYIPAAAANIGACTLTNVAKKTLYQTTLLGAGLFRKGLYKGGNISVGSNPQYTKLAECWGMTAEDFQFHLLEEDNAFPHPPNTNANEVRYDLCCILHEYQPTDPPPSFDFMAVQGTAVVKSATAQPQFPTEAEILIAAAAVDPKYDSMDHVIIVGFARVEGNAGNYALSDITSAERLSEKPSQLAVSALFRGNQVWGEYGLQTLLRSLYETYIRDTVRTPLNSGEMSSFTVNLEGDFQLRGTLIVPSLVILKGKGATIRTDLDEAVHVGGRHIQFDTFNPVWSGVASADQIDPLTGLPFVGYTRYELSIGGTYRSGWDLDQLMISWGDRILLTSVTGTNRTEGWFEEFNGDNWSFKAVFDDAGALDPAVDFSNDMVLFKNGSGIEDISTGPLTLGDTNDHGVNATALCGGRVENCVVKTLTLGSSILSKFRNVLFGSLVLETSRPYVGRMNEYMRLRGSGAFTVGTDEINCRYEDIDSNGAALTVSGASMVFAALGRNSSGVTATAIANSLFRDVLNNLNVVPGGPMMVASTNHFLYVKGNMSIQAGATGNVAFIVTGSWTNLGGATNYKIDTTARVQRGTGMFNSTTGVTVPLSPVYADANYRVEVTPNVSPGGTLGEIWVASKTTVSFKVHNSGTNMTATFDWIAVHD